MERWVPVMSDPVVPGASFAPAGNRDQRLAVGQDANTGRGTDADLQFQRAGRHLG